MGKGSVTGNSTVKKTASSSQTVAFRNYHKLYPGIHENINDDTED